nr:glycosyltransferase family 1 protein [Extibacter muris]
MDAISGSSVRPYKMIEAFKNEGYLVDCIIGYGKERNERIKTIRENISQGIKYDFVYSESSTMPTLLTEKNHIPTYPLLDFGFLKYCKRNKIKIGLFYRDIYWKFPIYKEAVSLYKRMVSIPMYHYDLHQYKKVIDVLYLPSLRMQPYLKLPVRCEALPPGCSKSDFQFNRKVEKKINLHADRKALKLFYVGGVGSIYDLTKLFSVVKKLDFIELVVCCRKEEWESRYDYYRHQMCRRIEIVHESGEALDKYYKDADISMIFFDAQGYRSFAMPIKLFEYISNRTPVIATKGSAAGDFVKENDVGWSIEFDEDVLADLLTEINGNRSMLLQKKSIMKNALESNTWEERAKQVIRGLTENKG